MSGYVRKTDYSKGLIYKLCCKDPTIEDIYIGSTTNFRNRKSTHKSMCNNSYYSDYNNKVYKFIRENGGFENWDMILIQYYSCNGKRQLEAKEREYIEILKSTLNTNIPTRTKKEYNQDTKINRLEWVNNNNDKIKNNRKNYYENNKEKLKEKSKVKIECEYCKCIITKRQLKRHQQSLKCKKFQLQDYSD
tara:strand:- start:43 stop:615 length:573 start_codon:yes stop_codon:yes gene_type:complete